MKDVDLFADVFVYAFVAFSMGICLGLAILTEFQ